MQAGDRHNMTSKLKSCRACRFGSLLLVLSLGDQALSHFIEAESDEVVTRFPLNLVVCTSCGLVQLREAAPKELLYAEDYGYRSGISEIIKNDLADIVECALVLRPVRQGEIVVDIGCNDGTLLDFYPQHLQRIGFDPLEKFEAEVSSKGVAFINDYFGSRKFMDIAGSSKAAIVTAISMFYDLDDPNGFLEQILDIMAEDGIFVIQQNYLISMLENNAFDNICHEHLEYYSLRSLQSLLEKHGLSIFDVTLNEINGGSVRTYICRTGERNISDEVSRLIAQEPPASDFGYYQRFQERCEQIKETIVKFIHQRATEGRTIFALGASTRGNTLLQYFDLDYPTIAGAMERNPEKYGKKIASVGIPILSEEQCREYRPDYLLVLPWHLREQIITREVDFLAQGGRLVFPLPRPSVVSREGETPLM